jgi:hypothetical protein
MYDDFDSISKKRRVKKPTTLQQAEKLLDIALNGKDEFDDATVGTLCTLVRGTVKLQCKRSVLTGLHKAYTQWCRDEKSPRQQKDCIDLGLTLLACAPNFTRFQRKYNQKLLKRKVGIGMFYSSLTDSDNPMPVRLRALEMRDWYYYHPTKMYSPYRENPINSRDVKEIYTAAFRKNAKDVTVQQRLLDVLEKAAQPSPEKHHACLNEDEFMDLLKYPMMKSKDNALQIAAVKLGFKYIDPENQEAGEWLAESLNTYADLIEPICSDEAYWMREKSKLVVQEAALATIHKKFFEDMEEPMKKRDYPTIQKLFEAHNQNFNVTQAIVAAARQEFTTQQPVPALFRA